MNKKEIYRVSRSWAGHLATNPKLRMNVKGLDDHDAALADLINSTVQPPVKVDKTDVSSIRGLVRNAFGGPLPDDDDGGVCTFNRFDDPGDDE